MDSKLPSSVKYIYAYIRRSRQDLEREKRTDQDTLAEQRALLERILNERYQHYDWDLYEEVGSGADAIEERPVFRHIIEELQKVKPRTVAIMVKDISRLGRGSYEQMGFLEKIILEKCIYIITPFQTFDPLDDNDMEYIKFHMFFANMEYSKITRRMREARYTYAVQGRWMTGGGGIPYGYKFNSFTQRLEPDEETAWVVRKIFDYYVNHRIGYNAISTKLREEGIPSPIGKTYWKPMVIRRILRNPVYIGTVQFRTTRLRNKKKIKLEEKDWIVAENAHPPLIDKQTFEKAAEIMEENKNSPKVRLDFEPQPLAGLIVCSSCGNKMQRQYSRQYYTKKDGTQSVYDKEFLNCLACRVYMKYRTVEQEILRILQEDFINVDTEILRQRLEEMIDLDKMKQKNSVNPTDRVLLIQKQLESLDGELTALRRMLRKGQITDEEYEKDRAEILKQKEEKERQLYFLQAETHKEQIEEVNVESIQQGFKTLYDLYVNGDLSKGEKNEILRGIFDYIVLEKTGKGKFNLHAYINPKIILNTISSASH
ncbi:recombinase family protein [Anoxybacillus flavithermus]|uniref:recombinase family protein n=1 Tax=Anoxybacillus flavithermus TaxID=33934 RepID=UPI00186939BA|nr:recombinase family protein [Anoxybacillus flavithermus]MBE2919616.1 recombinase family protein [Anoxybacillus flavithermus]